MKSVLKHKWVVPIGALVLVLAIGAVAWAADTTTTSSSAAGQTTTTTSAGQTTTPGDGAHNGFGFFGERGMGRQMMGGSGQGTKDSQWQQRLDSIMKLVRDKMSAEDQAALDQLQTQAQTQRDALTQAQQNLRDTNSKLQSLIDKYLAPSAVSGADSGSSGTTESTATTGTTGA